MGGGDDRVDGVAGNYSGCLTICRSKFLVMRGACTADVCLDYFGSWCDNVVAAPVTGREMCSHQVVSSSTPEDKNSSTQQ